MDTILFFDGVCVMCNSLVDFVLKHDKAQIVKFAPLQGPTAHRLIPQYCERLNTVVLLDENGTYTESDAIVRIFSKLGGIYSMASALKIFPKALRDWVYRWISKNRYRFFGKNDHCRLPTPSERSRMLE